MTETKLEEKNYDKGACTVTDVNGDKKVVLNAVTTKTCNFACKEGYYRTNSGTNIAFTCAPNGGVTNAAGSSNWDTIGECQGA